MKKLLNILGIFSLSIISTTSSIACDGNKLNNNNENNNIIKILEEKINNTSLDSIEDSTKEKKSIKAEEKLTEFQQKANEYKIKFEVNNEDINLQLFILYSLKTEEAFFKTFAIQHEKITNLPPSENDKRRHLYNKIKDIQKGKIIFFNKNEYKINQLLVNLANGLEQKYYL